MKIILYLIFTSAILFSCLLHSTNCAVSITYQEAYKMLIGRTSNNYINQNIKIWLFYVNYEKRKELPRIATYLDEFLLISQIDATLHNVENRIFFAIVENRFKLPYLEIKDRFKDYVWEMGEANVKDVVKDYNQIRGFMPYADENSESESEKPKKKKKKGKKKKKAEDVKSEL